MASNRVGWIGWPVVVHSVRTAIAAVVSILVARLFRLPEAYWAPITTFVITQSSLGAALTVSWQRFVGTALGALLGAIVGSHFGPNIFVFGTSVFILGLLCAIAHSDRSAYRFGGVTLAIVLLIPRTGAALQIAFHRFAEVSVGIGVALILTVVWPESEPTPSGKDVNSPPRKSDGDQGGSNLSRHYREVTFHYRREILNRLVCSEDALKGGMPNETCKADTDERRSCQRGIPAMD